MLGKEFIDVFDADILLMFHPGSGEMMKAVMLKQKIGIAICKSQTHKQVFMDNLKDFATRMNLVSCADGPTKPDALIAYEKSMAGKNQAPLAANPTAVPLIRPQDPTPVALTVPAAKPPPPAHLEPRASALAAFGTSML